MCATHPPTVQVTCVLFGENSIAAGCENGNILLFPGFEGCVSANGIIRAAHHCPSASLAARLRPNDPGSIVLSTLSRGVTALQGQAIPHSIRLHPPSSGYASLPGTQHGMYTPAASHQHSKPYQSGTHDAPGLSQSH